MQNHISADGHRPMPEAVPRVLSERAAGKRKQRSQSPSQGPEFLHDALMGLALSEGMPPAKQQRVTFAPTPRRPGHRALSSQVQALEAGVAQASDRHATRRVNHAMGGPLRYSPPPIRSALVCRAPRSSPTETMLSLPVQDTHPYSAVDSQDIDALHDICLLLCGNAPSASTAAQLNDLLIDCIRRPWHEGARKLLSFGVCANGLIGDPYGPLLAAIEDQDLQMVQLLRSFGALAQSQADQPPNDTLVWAQKLLEMSYQEGTAVEQATAQGILDALVYPLS